MKTLQKMVQYCDLYVYFMQNELKPMFSHSINGMHDFFFNILLI